MLYQEVTSNFQVCIKNNC